MMKACNRCSAEKDKADFYPRDNSCKECRKAIVRANRAANISYYREYDRQRANLPHRVKARQEYAESDAGKLSHAKSLQAQRLKHPHKSDARGLLLYAVAYWGLPRPENCNDCGISCTPHGHHEDYSKPLDVIWLCVSCHAMRHKKTA